MHKIKACQIKQIVNLKTLIFSLILFSASSCIPQKNEPSQSSNIPTIKVLLSKVSKQDSLSFSGTYFLETEEARYEFGSSNNKVYIQSIKDGYKIYNEKRLFLFRKNDKVHFIPENNSSVIKHSKKEYSGNLSILKEDSTNLYLINHLDLESYLQGVVPAEIFTNNAEQMEAVKAQAICARTYALKKMENRKNKSYHVYADIRDQAYGGAGQKTKLGNQAVLETIGSALFFDNKLADAYFHASCGGVSEEANSVWEGPETAYLKSQQDIVGKEFADLESPYFRWTMERDAAQLDSMFNNKFNISYLNKTVQDTMDIPFRMFVKERSASGRVTKLAVNYGTDSQELSGYEIRRFLGWPIGKLLPSTLFKLSASDSTFIINGAGNGHGVGMCQYGAMYKAQKGLQYYHILQSYYPGTVLRKVY
ncbi:MAG: SpoIID/LytB domain-containing protein [Calditrichaeota bacterium]|nr:MAG: SpoIID/LytB domain-containing protein [Calditrichota bacterium]MBL1205656.1 SpoIID/LytB domain-containing protein [Calditrichota bacterium]NOG45484.1 SpoIID/LytB domain-containing protein [Calditrichota bacterium]